AGRTIAQLATQHIHAAPNLEPLPPADRVAVARALEKNPDRRFENCKAFVDALRSPGSANNTVSVRENRRGAAKRPSHSAPTRGNVEDLPELNSSATHLHSRVTGHAFVVAVGGVGAEILHELRGRVAELHAACPLDLHSVLIDTDMHTIHAARLTEASDRIPPTVMVHTPLKTAQEYRQSNTKPLSSMSRRWIYNVPRSATTEGLRPLGRLAMVGHAEEVDQALRESIDHLAAVCGDRVPSVYLVGSLSGGTASGMMWDLAPRLRQLLDEAGLQSAGVLPLLTTVSIQGNPHQPLTLINTHAAVSELRHYLTPGHSYPGDPGVAWDPVPAARNPLHDAYLIVDGDRASPVSSSAAATVVDYLWADSTGAGELLAQARKIANLETGQIGKPMLRSVGVARLQCLRALEQKLLAPAAVRHLMLGWLGHPAEAEQIAKPLAERLRKRCQIEPQQWLAELLEQYGRNDVARQELVSSFVKQIDTAQIQNGCQGIDIDEKLRKMLEGGKLASLSQRRSGDVMATLRRELTTRLHDRGIDVTGAIHGIAVFRQNLVAACKQLNEELSSHADEGCMHSRDADSVAGSASMTDLIEQTERFVLRRMHAITTQLVLDQLEELIKETAPIAESLQQMAVTVAQGARCVPGDQQDSENPWDDMPQEIRIRFQDVLKNLHSQVSQQWLIQPLLRTRDVDSPSMDQIARMVDEMVSSCLPVVESIIDRHRSTHSTRGESIGSTTTGSVASSSSVSASALCETATVVRDSASLTQRSHMTEGVMETQSITSHGGHASRFNEQTTIESALEVAAPPLLQCGGCQRLLLLVGTEAEKRKLEPSISKACSGALTTVVIPGVTPVLIHEAQQIAVEGVLERLELVSAADKRVSQRLHTRGDIRWNEPVSG
ncbi:MAG: tubulin-like doman-containing protein, partial [Planctomycetota bacterium]